MNIACCSNEKRSHPIAYCSEAYQTHSFIHSFHSSSSHVQFYFFMDCCHSGNFCQIVVCLMMWIIHYNPHHRFEHAIIRSSNSWKYSYMAFLGILISTKKQVLFSYFTQSQADFLKSRLLKFSYQAGAKICYHLTPCNHISSDWLKNLLYEFLSATIIYFLEKNKVQQLLRESCIVQNFVL